MCADKYGNRINNKEFGWIKRNISKEQSKKRIGQTKENNERVARMAKTKTGQTKENHKGIANGAAKRKGRTKETHEYLEKMAEKQRGKTNENNLGRLSQSEKRTGRTKENHVGTAAQSKKMKGRNKKTHLGIAVAAEKNNILSIELRNMIIEKRDNGETYQKIYEWILSLNIKISYSALPPIYNREKKKLSELLT